MKRRTLYSDFETTVKIFREFRNEAIRRRSKSEDPSEIKALNGIRIKLDEELMRLQLGYILEQSNIKVAITDIDSVIFKNNMIRVVFELKHRNEDFRKFIMVNARQYMTHKRICKLMGDSIPFYYVFRIEDESYHDPWWRILKIDPFRKVEFKELGKGGSKDIYAIFNLEDGILMNDLEFKSWLSGIFREKHCDPSNKKEMK